MRFHKVVPEYEGRFVSHSGGPEVRWTVNLTTLASVGGRVIIIIGCWHKT